METPPLMRVTVSDASTSESDLTTLFVHMVVLGASRDMNPNGVGLGLSICKDVVEQLAGQLSPVNSAEHAFRELRVTATARPRNAGEFCGKKSRWSELCRTGGPGDL